MIKHDLQLIVGHLNYYGITDNWQMCSTFRAQFTQLMYKWRNRQSQKRSYDWERFRDALAWVGWPSVRIKHQLEPYRRVSTLNGN